MARASEGIGAVNASVPAHPLATVEVGTEQVRVRAAVRSEPERTPLYDKMVEMTPGFAEHRKKTTRVIPVITLTLVK